MRAVRITLATLLTTALAASAAYAAPDTGGGAEATASSAYVSIGESTTGTTYYVDGAAGDDDADGTSPETAWRSLDKVTATTFEPGDHILLEANSTWNDQMLHPKGSGTEGNVIAIDLYERTDNGAVYEADTRPVINANGTYGTGDFKRYITGAVQLVNQEFWQIQNLEVTNSPELSNLDRYKKSGDAQRAGILVMGYEQDRVFRSVRVANNYVHDVQSEYFQRVISSEPGVALKATGGIIVLGHWVDPDGNNLLPQGEWRSSTGFTDVVVEHNVVKRVGVEGIRTKADANTAVQNSFKKTFSDIIIRNNYLEDVSGDAIVMSELSGGGIVEGNVSVRAANADYGARNFAGMWAMSNDNGLFQYNEVYGIIYGYNDAEAYDIDLASNYVLYQYNYSHHNTGGFILLMSDQRNSTVRYNISANDGGGNRGTDADNGGGGSCTYKEQSIFHYWVKNEGAAMPQIYNNTFYVGDGISTSLYGEGNSGDNSGTVAHFWNNIIVKEGEGTFKFLSANPSNGANAIERKMVDNPERYFKNNVIWPESIATATSGATPEKLALGNNVFADPQLAISRDPALVGELALQASTVFDDATDNIVDFTSTAKLRDRASLFTITDESAAAGAGMTISDAAARAGAPTEDFFGNNVAGMAADVGAHQASQVATVVEVIVPEVPVTTVAGVYPTLPTSLEVTVRETAGGNVTERTETRSVTWDVVPMADYQEAGTVTVEGTVHGNPPGQASATVTVTGELGEGVNESRSVATDSAFVQRGSGNTAMSAAAGTIGSPSASEAYKHPFGATFNNNYGLRLKNAGSAGFNRRIYVEVDPSQFSGDLASAKSATLRLYVWRFDAWNGAGGTAAEQLRNTQLVADVYATEPTWTSNAVTWNNGPLNAEVAVDSVPDYDALPLVSSTLVTNSDIIDNGYALDLDVSEYIRTLPEGTESASFLVVIPMSTAPNYNRDNAGFDAFSHQGAAAAFDRYQAGSLTLPEGMAEGFEMSATALAPSLYVSDVYLTEIESVTREVAPLEVPDLPETVTVSYSDGSSREVSVTWPTITPEELAEPGTYTFTGTAAGIPAPIVATVIVSGAELTGFAELETIDRPVGLSRGELGLPTTVTGTLEDGTTIELTVTGWDDDPNNYGPDSPPGTYRFPGSVELPAGVSNPDDHKPQQTVVTHPKPASVNLSASSDEVVQGGELAISSQVVGQEPYTEVDEWGSELAWSIEPSVESVTVDDDGVVRATEDAPEGEYVVTATSTRVDGVSGNYTLTVVADEPTVPTRPVVVIGSGGGVVSLVDPVVVSGSAEPGSTGWKEDKAVVYAEVQDAAGKKVLGRSVPVTDGAWTVSFDVSGLAAGQYTVKVSASSKGAGNGSATVPLELTTPRVPGPATDVPGKGVLSSDNWDGDGDYVITMNMWWGQNGWAVELFEDGVLVGAQDLVDGSPGAQSASFPVTGRPNGTYVYTAVLSNQHGETVTAPLTVTVSQANPGVPVLSHDNWDGDGSFTVSMNMWWGTNASSVRLYEDGELVATKALTPNGRGHQSASFPLTGRSVGTHAYTAVLANAQGETESAPLKVLVQRP